MTLLEWWNFVFAMPLVVGALLLLGLTLSGLIDLSSDHAHSEAHAGAGDAHHGADAHHEVAHPGDADHEMAHADHHDAAHDADHADHHDAHHEVDSHAPIKTPYTSHDDHGAEKPYWLKFLNLFGVGMGLPVSLALPLLMMVWGVSGLITNRLLEPILKAPGLFVPVSVVAALIVMAFAGRSAALVIRRVLREEAPQIVDKYGLIGATGYAVYAITPEGGVAHVRDRYGNLHRIVCRTVPGEPDIPANTPILVARYDEATHLYWVERNPLELSDTAHHETQSTQSEQIGERTTLYGG